MSYLSIKKQKIIFIKSYLNKLRLSSLQKKIQIYILIQIPEILTQII